MKTNIRTPRILIVSNNALSDTSNNGKTIASFFADYPKENIRQLYFKPEIPTGVGIDSFFQITDKDMLNSLLGNKRKPGKIQDVSNDRSDKDLSGIHFPINNTTRLIREVVWSISNWDTDKLNNWLNEFMPEIIFFVAGDSGFAYNIVTRIKERYNTKLITYITDDYILPRKTLNPLWWIKRQNILGKMEDIINDTNLLLTISPKMKNMYKQFFKKDSVVMTNMTESLKDNKEYKKSEVYRIIYTGGLHLQRYQVLIQFANAIEKYNKRNKDKKQVQLDIYTNQVPDKKILNKLNIPGSSSFCGSVNSSELKTVLNKADFPLFVESFGKKSIESTRLSLSTKIPEYLSLGKAIIAIGPQSISSMEYLSSVAYCVYDTKDLEKELDFFINHADKDDLRVKAKKLYEKNHNSKKNLQFLNGLIINL